MRLCFAASPAGNKSIVCVLLASTNSSLQLCQMLHVSTPLFNVRQAAAAADDQDGVV